MRNLLTLLLLALALHATAQSPADSLLSRYDAAPRRQQPAIAAELARLLDADGVTDSLLCFDPAAPADTVAAQLCFWVAEQHVLAAEFAEAAPLLERALALTTEADLLMRGDCLAELAICYARMGLFSKAIDAAARTIAIDEQLSDPERLVYSLNTMGGIYAMARQPEEAEKFTLRSLDLARELGDSAKMAVRLAAVAEIRQTMGDYQQALDLAR